ncbi:MAG: (2Fe-2S)-binding protein, partial [Leptolyngbyaceae cyanobacterium MAG.088]|nr:(2Fe-2S)-binding protein [Leptolyngbyaceae cyanobacterium MAG.088]
CPFHALKFDGAGCTVLPGSKTKTLPQKQPLELVVQGDFIWSYGGHEPRLPIPSVMKEISDTYRFVGHTADCSVETDLLSMLLIMHDYNHQNGTHRELFRVTQVDFQKFIDNGHQSHAFFDMVTDKHRLIEKLKKPDLFILPDTLTAHIENHFPSFVILYSKSSFLGKIIQCHFFIPEAENRTRTYILLFCQANYLTYKLLGKSMLNFGKVVVEQDADILNKLYANAPQNIKLNNEVGMDWVKRNFKSFPRVIAPNLSKS